MVDEDVNQGSRARLRAFTRAGDEFDERVGRVGFARFAPTVAARVSEDPAACLLDRGDDFRSIVRCQSHVEAHRAVLLDGVPEVAPAVDRFDAREFIRNSGGFDLLTFLAQGFDGLGLRGGD